jgi:hypothetical protein
MSTFSLDPRGQMIVIIELDNPSGGIAQDGQQFNDFGGQRSSGRVKS